jgi:hypothetical protein
MQVTRDSLAHYHGFSLVYINMIEQYDSMLRNIYTIEIQLNNNMIEIQTNYK